MTSEAKALAAAIRPAIGWIREQIRRDAANRYSLLADWSLPACRCSWWPDSIPVWESDLFRIERVAPGIVAVTVRAYESTAERNVCDGATMSPDTPAGVLPAAIFHDPWYFRESDEEPRQYELVARACGVSARQALKGAAEDAGFQQILLLPDPLAADPHAEDRTHVVPMARLSEGRPEPDAADVLGYVQLALLHVLRQEEGHGALGVHPAAGEDHAAEAQVRVVLQGPALRGREKARVCQDVFLFAAAGQILAAL